MKVKKHCILFTLDAPSSAVFTGSDGQVLENAPVNLTCSSTDGQPAPTLEISRGGSVLKTGSSPLEYAFSLTGAEDGAEYKCNASNRAGSAVASQTFSVISESKSFKNVWLQPHQSYAILGVKGRTVQA